MRKKILFIIWSFSMGGGAEKILANILNNINLNKYDVDVLEYISFDIKQEKIPYNINRINPILNKNSNKVKRIFFDKSCSFFPKIIRNIYLNKEYDIEISFNERIPSFLLNKNAKKICWIHGSMYGIENNRIDYMRQKKVFANAEKVIAISDNTYTSIIKLFPSISNKIIKIYNGYDFKEMSLKSKFDSNVKLEKKSLVLIGRLDEGKRPHLAIDCLKRLHEKGYKYHLYILGTGHLLEKLIQLVNNYDLNKYVHFLGYVENPLPIIKQSSAIVSFSKSEGFPTTFVEGLTLGIPFISSNVGGANELCNNNKCGRIFNNIDEAESILEMYYNDIIKFDKNTCINFVSKFSIQNQINKLEQLLDDMS